MARLPQVGGDDGNWGRILNDYLSQSLTDDGQLQPGSVGRSQLRDASVTTPAIAEHAITEAKLESTLLSKVNAGVADNAITTNKLADNAVTTEKISGLGSAYGVASLDGDGRLPEAQVPERLSTAELSANVKDSAGRRLDRYPMTGFVGNRVLFDGDSLCFGIVGSTGGDTSTNGTTCADSAPTYAMLSSDGRWRHVYNAGVPGQRSDQILARQAASIARGIDVLVYVSPGYHNDLFQTHTPEFTLANIEAMIVGALAAGVLPVICTPTPDGRGTPTPARNVWLRTVRARVIALCARYGVPLVDVWTPLVDPSGGTLPTNFNVDGSVHPTAQAYMRMGQAIDVVLRRMIPPIANVRLTDRGTGNPDLLAGVGMFMGTAVGGVPGGWSYSAGTTATTPTVETPADVNGRAFRITSAAGTGSGTASAVLGGEWSVGDVLEVSGCLLVSGAGIRAQLQIFASGAPANVRELKPVNVVPGGALARGGFAKRYIIPAGTTTLTVYLQSLGGVAGYAEFAEVGVTNLTALAAVD